jgi:RNA polymerase sigma-70 factor (ECF subfamily)
VRVLTRPGLVRGHDERPCLLRALRNTYLTRLRTAGRRPRTVDLPADDRERLRSSLAEPEIAVEQVELLEMIAALPSDLREALVAVDLLGLSYREAARALRTRDTTITMRLFRARRRMACSLKGDPDAAGTQAGPCRSQEGDHRPPHRPPGTRVDE